jgi:hypothetical protein
MNGDFKNMNLHFCKMNTKTIEIFNITDSVFLFKNYVEFHVNNILIYYFLIKISNFH